jgi:hypothetical protein
MSVKSISLDTGYTAIIDCVDEQSWYEIFDNFRDANIYQTWAYGAARFGENNISHLILKKDKKIIAAVQARIATIPIIRAGIAYVRCGPLWRKKLEDDRLDDFHNMLVAMVREYVDHRGLCLRIIPNEFEQDNKKLKVILESIGFRWNESNDRTLLLPLSEPLDIIRKNMSKKWRKNLLKAEKNKFQIVEGTGQYLFETVINIYREMLLRKGFEPGINVKEYQAIQARLPDHLKMKIMICQSEGQPIAALVGSFIGDVGIELIAATTKESLELGASFLLRWKMTEYLKNCGCLFYDLNGINPERNPGGYQFKSGLAGKLGKDLKFLGIFQAEGRWISSFAVNGGEILMAGYKKVMKTIKSHQNF